MSSTESKNSGHTAISSWSGYLYQGKIAIYHVLKLLTSNMDISNFSLRLDCEEDFDILNNNDVVSLHQVKGKGADTIGKYSEAFNDIKSKDTNYPKATLYFHLAKRIRNKSIVDIERDYSPVKVYSYSKDKYNCTLDEVDSLIESLVKSYLIKNEVEVYKLEVSYIIQVREKLDELIINKVVDLHHRNMLGENDLYYLAEQNPIRFDEFETVLLSNDIKDWANSQAYILFLAKYTFNKYLDIYLFENEIDIKTEKRLRKYIEYICNMNDVEIQKFIRSLIPHKKVVLKGIKDYVGASIQGDDLRHAFYEMLSSISSELYLENGNLYWINNESNSLIPTAIDKYGKKQAINTCKDIIENIKDTDMHIAFECQKLVTTELNTNSIFDTANNTNEARSDDDDTGIESYRDESKRISRWRSVSLISIENAKKELDND